MRLIAWGLVVISMVGLLRIFGPIAALEVSYQFKQFVGNFPLHSLIFPSFSLRAGRITTAAESYELVIPRIDLREPIVMNVDAGNKSAYSQALADGVAHAAGTALPGKEGLGYYFAHSSGLLSRFQASAVFYLLGKLEPGDEIRIEQGTKAYHYRVSESRVTAANDVSFLQSPPRDEQIVLQTCWPIGTNWKRLLVFGERVE